MSQKTRKIFVWNPAGLSKFSFRDLKPFPISPESQFIAAILCIVAVILGSLHRLLLPINLNFVVHAVIGYYLGERVHPHPLIGPAAVTVCLIGMLGLTIFFMPDVSPSSAASMLVLPMNVFIGLAAGATLAAVTKPEPEKKDAE